MFDGIQYFPAMSTRAHEQLAYAKCPSSVKNRMVPIVTLTRYDREETLEETASILLNDLDGRPAIVDFDPLPREMTSAEEAAERRRRKQEVRAATGQKEARARSPKELANDAERRRKTAAFNGDIHNLTDPRQGPIRWVEMISEFPELLPILGHGSRDVIQGQLDVIGRKGTRGALRLDPRQPYASTAISGSLGSIRDHIESLLIIVDLKSIRGEATASIAAAKSFLAQLYEGLGNDADHMEVVLLSNSFPPAKSSLRDLSRTLHMDELRVHREITGTFPARYGDYMSVPPRRGSGRGGNGWFPHVDLVTPSTWHIGLYENNSDKWKYIDASIDTVGGENWESRADCWGTSVIKRVAEERTLQIDGKNFTSPTGWISVRANQHLTQMALNR